MKVNLFNLVFSFNHCFFNITYDKLVTKIYHLLTLNAVNVTLFTKVEEKVYVLRLQYSLLMCILSFFPDILLIKS